MAGRFTFRQLLDAAARAHPGLWSADGELNLSAVARHYASKGHPVSQPTLHRQYKGRHGRLDEKTTAATHHVFGIPLALLRGDRVPEHMEKLLADYNLSTLFLAQRIERLPKTAYDAVVRQIAALEEQQDELRRARENGANVSSIDKHRR